MIPPLKENYFGNALVVSVVRMKAMDVLECGTGKVALELNKMVSLHSDEKIRNHYESWLRMLEQSLCSMRGKSAYENKLF